MQKPLKEVLFSLFKTYLDCFLNQVNILKVTLGRLPNNLNVVAAKHTGAKNCRNASQMIHFLWQKRLSVFIVPLYSGIADQWLSQRL